MPCETWFKLKIEGPRIVDAERRGSAEVDIMAGKPALSQKSRWKAAAKEIKKAEKEEKVGKTLKRKAS